FAHTEININPMHKIASGLDPNFQAMESLTSRAAPLLRPEGSGRIMQQEWEAFKKAFPNVRNIGEANEQERQQLHNEAANRRTYANFMGDWLQAHGSLTG